MFLNQSATGTPTNNKQDKHKANQARRKGATMSILWEDSERKAIHMLIFLFRNFQFSHENSLSSRNSHVGILDGFADLNER